MRSAFHLAFALTITLAFSRFDARAAVGFRQLTSVYPCAVQRGTTAVVAVRSNFTLDRAYASFVLPAGPTLKLAETKPIEAPLTGRGRPGTPFKFEATVPADQMPGVYELRIATPEAVSSVTHLLVTDYPVVTEDAKPNGAPASAQSVGVPAAVCGQIDEAEDVDCFRFAGKRGQTITMQIYAQRVTAAIHDMVGPSQTYHMDAILTLYSPNGQVVGLNDNVFGGDAVRTVELAQDGDYVLAVRDTRYLGNPRYTYCVEISEGLPAVATFPMVVESGKPADVDVLTVGGRKMGTAKVDIAGADDRGTVIRRLRIGDGETNPVAIGVSTVAQIQHDAATTLAAPRELALPAGVNARLAKPGDAHCFAFTAVKDSYYTLAAESRRFNMPVDAVLEVYDAKGAKVAEADDSPLSADARLTFKAAADGRYTALVRDLHLRGGDEFVYHLSIEQAGPDFEITGKYYYAMVAPGTRAMWFAAITRLNGFDGPIELRVEGLPAGVVQTPVTVPAGMSHAGIILSADKSAKIGASLVRITGRAKVREPGSNAEKEIVREGVITCELQNGGGGQGHWPVRTSLVGVVEPLDLLSVAATPAEITLAPGSKADLTVTIERNAAYKDPVTIDFTWIYFSGRLGEQLPPGVTVAKGSTARLSGNTLTGKITLEASPTATPVERLPIAVMAGVSISFSIDTKYASNPIYLTVPPADKKIGPVAKK